MWYYTLLEQTVLSLFIDAHDSSIFTNWGWWRGSLSLYSTHLNRD